jgi:hypothetical protein
MPITEARKRMNRDYEWVIREGLTKCLLHHGFRRNRNLHWRDYDPTVTCEIWPARPTKWVEPNAVNFWFYCGISVKAYAELFPEYFPKGFVPGKAPMQLDVSPSMLTASHTAEFRFEAGASQEALAAVARSISRLFEEVVLPWYAQFKSAKDVGDYLASPEKGPGRSPLPYRDIPQRAFDLRNAAIAYFGAGDYARAREMLGLAEATIDRHGRHATADLRQRIERLIAQRQQARGETKLGESR